MARGEQGGVDVRVSLVMPNLLTWDGERLVTGGLERFAWYLIDAARDAGYAVDVHQNASKDWSRTVRGVRVRGHGLAAISPLAALESIHHETERCLYLSILQESQAFRPASLVVSHGVWWDRKGVQVQDHLDLCRSVLEQAAEVVSVDYNFQSVMRATFPDYADRITVIPNPVDLETFSPPAATRGGRVSVLFPRRLDPARGLEIFLEAMAPLLESYPDLAVVLAVDANDPEKTSALRRRLDESPFAGRAVVRTASFEEMPELYRQVDIVAIPSLHSEGTSLALLEALASGRAVVASDVGGMTNVVLDGFNGMLIRPRALDLREAIERLVTDADLRKRLGASARASAAAFGLPRWRQAWQAALRRVYGDPGPER